MNETALSIGAYTLNQTSCGKQCPMVPFPTGLPKILRQTLLLLLLLSIRSGNIILVFGNICFIVGYRQKVLGTGSQIYNFRAHVSSATKTFPKKRASYITFKRASDQKVCDSFCCRCNFFNDSPPPSSFFFLRLFGWPVTCARLLR